MVEYYLFLICVCLQQANKKNARFKNKESYTLVACKVSSCVPESLVDAVEIQIWIRIYVYQILIQLLLSYAHGLTGVDQTNVNLYGVPPRTELPLTS